VGQLVALLRNERAVLDVAVPLLGVLLAVAAHNAASRKLIRDAGGLPLLASLLVRGDVHARPVCGKHNVTISDLSSRVLLQLQSPDGGSASDKLFAMYDAGVFAAVAPLLGAATGKCAALFGREAELEAPGCVLAAAYAVDDLKPIVRQYLASVPGALAGLALGARNGITHGSQETLARLLEQLTKDPPAPAKKADPRLEPTAFESGQWLLDPHFAVCAMLELRIPTGSDAARFARMCTVLLKALLAAAPTVPPSRCDWRSTTGTRVLVQPLAEQRLSAAVSAALLVRDGDQFRQILRGGVQLDTLLAAFASCDEGSTPARWSYDWTRRALHTAVKTAVAASRLAAAAAGASGGGADEPPAKRQRSLGAALSAADVIFKRHDSTVLLIAGKEFYFNGELTTDGAEEPFSEGPAEKCEDAA
jgi:hypothetical protein